MGAVSWSVVSGGLPAGLTLNGTTGVVAGIPATSGLFSATVQARDSWDASRVVNLPVAISVAPGSDCDRHDGTAAGEGQPLIQCRTRCNRWIGRHGVDSR